ncbi:RND family efflux transporter MFP subunit [Isoalcanivorax pacificus W11-5]|uniref:RND family efflux transporter MFP subunit n=1 Tax=Isoalcanivorax pacificus W11-5 TaxID=391936 RepID=A0A0B4XUQ1_9GAMM|nr:efflux RND transporter periplasmic adaptor subunit [Isoalcanivorax pacificus]AJD49982.1 RND family efflux transporter MFP subunit [Isoalcanivorax pacificus W11-5]
MNKRFIIVIAACVVVFGGVFALQMMLRKGMNDFFDNMPMPAASVTAAEAQSFTWERGISAVGTARAVNGTQLTTQAAGIVTEIRFNSGDMVKKGDILLRLDDATDRAELQALRAAAELSRLELERTRRLQNQGSVSKAELDRAQSQYDQAQGSLNTQEARVAQKTIRAPFDGQLGIRQVDLGEYVAAGAPVVSVQQLSPIYIEFSLPEQRLSELALDLEVDVTVDAWPDDTFTGSITAIEPGIDRSTRNFTAQATLANEDGKLRSGMFARVNVDLGEAEEVLAVPQTAISYNPYGNAVFVIVEKQNDAGETQLVVNRRFVRTGRTRGDYVAIVEGLEEGDRIATSGLLKLNNNATVTISEDVNLDPQLEPTPDNT